MATAVAIARPSVLSRRGQETRAELQETRAELQETRAELQETRAELQETRAELQAPSPAGLYQPNDAANSSGSTRPKR